MIDKDGWTAAIVALIFFGILIGFFLFVVTPYLYTNFIKLFLHSITG